jgi:hypothetical protein
MLHSLDLRLRQHCEFLTLPFVKIQFFKNEVMKTKDIYINVELQTVKIFLSGAYLCGSLDHDIALENLPPLPQGQTSGYG